MRLPFLAAGLALLAGCSTAPDTAVTAEPAPEVQAAATTAPAQPAHLTYPAIGVNTDLTPTGLDTSGAVQVSPLDTPQVVNYLAWSPRQAAIRPTVIVAHVSGRNHAGQAVEGAFFQLHTAKVGDRFTVTRSDGTTSTYRVTASALYPKAQFPTAVVYGEVRTPTTVELITCGGALADHSFLSDVVVTAVTA